MRVENHAADASPKLALVDTGEFLNNLEKEAKVLGAYLTDRNNLLKKVTGYEVGSHLHDPFQVAMELKKLHKIDTTYKYAEGPERYFDGRRVIAEAMYNYKDGKLTNDEFPSP
jgi:hypothetical protein